MNAKFLLGGELLTRCRCSQLEVGLCPLYAYQNPRLPIIEWITTPGFEDAKVKSSGFDWNAMRSLELDALC